MGKMGEKFLELSESEPVAKIKNWQDKIDRYWKAILLGFNEVDFANPDTLLESTFLTVIWDMSQTAFDIPREIQVVVDADDKLFMSVGTPGYVDFGVDPIGMKLPIKSWIHTHPFGRAYFSSTDWKTIRTWEPVMETAIVLGDNEYWAYNIPKKVVKTVKFAELVYTGVEEE